MSIVTGKEIKGWTIRWKSAPTVRPELAAPTKHLIETGPTFD